MQGIFIQYICLILIILGLVMIANKLRLAYPIVLVLGGLALSFIAQFSNIIINPELVFLMFLPPLLYEAAWQVSWKEFRKWRGLIIGFAFPIVILTSCVIAVVSSAIIPDFTLALGFLLGGIISPPDAVSATTIMRQVNVPKSLVSIVEGESLLNDASSLIVFRFALAAVLTGQFQFHQAAVNFVLVILIGILIGLVVGLIFYGIHRLLPTTSSIEIVLTLVTPYCMYYFAEHFHVSGVLAVVSGGLLLSSKRNSLLSYRSRVEGLNVWNNLVFVLNGLIFLLIGLELPFVTRQLGNISLGSAVWYGLIIAFVLIVTRLLCTLGTSVLMRVMSRFIPVSDPNPGWRGPLIFGWAGMRGVVSLASALSIPILTQAGQPFPYRDLILFITFIVILITLVFQGLTLPWLIRLVNLKDRFTLIPQQHQEIIIQKKLALASLRFLEEKYGGERARNEHLDNLFSKLEIDLKFFDRELEESNLAWQNSLKGYQSIYLEVLERRRELLNKMNRHAEFDEELIRKYLLLTDVEEFKVREIGSQESGTD
ncbi:Na+/H+ antiporter [Nostoc sp. 'Peltigera malacea cyanobiont' DB3992]|uniref:Na+/H+ antiporter n=1 Tax=Nostoc sp. 'Peltigera malacea cyanobiont' DB3992 TaxID=1206980 RepID=UPI000C054E20|nr:Na+/H+ antiporter [Nostoc sp. 'Peltigera malacea cyanobiont' DB3992]PHM08102.1 Na+/H+ antiporter [Nostoc sp. 'Peltigera malacea cyanobiont' DB3992]